MLIMVYGTLKKGYWNNRLLSGAEFVGEALTKKTYTMHGHGVPFINPDRDGLPVKGEVYRIDEKRHLPDLDRLEGHPNTYTRTTIDAQLLSNGEEVLVDIYEMVHSRWGTPSKHPPECGYYEWNHLH